MIFEQIVEKAPEGTVIPKPKAKLDFRVKGIGKRRGEEAIIYFVPNHKNLACPNEKGINRTEFEKAYEQLSMTGQFTREWFKTNLPDCNNEGSCNFTTIGGLFDLIGKAKYTGPGKYSRVE